MFRSLKFLSPKCQELRNSRKWVIRYHARLPRSKLRGPGAHPVRGRNHVWFLPCREAPLCGIRLQCACNRFKKRSSFRGDRFAPGRRVAKGGVRVHHRVPGAFGTVISRPHAPASRADELEQGAGFADACPATQAWGEDDFRPANLTGPDFGLHAGFSFSDPGIPARPVPHGRFPAGHPHGSPRFPLVQTALAFFSLPGFLPS